jgi:hypothetical protein
MADHVTRCVSAGRVSHSHFSLAEIDNFSKLRTTTCSIYYDMLHYESCRAAKPFIQKIIRKYDFFLRSFATKGLPDCTVYN